MVDVESKKDEIIRIVRSDFKGYIYFDIRKYYWAETEWRPTRKGITMSLKQAQKILDVAQEELKKIVDNLTDDEKQVVFGETTSTPAEKPAEKPKEKPEAK
jgi:hypothetical protein